MAVETIKKRTAAVRVENGTDSEGNVKTTTVSLGTLAKDRWDGDKALAIVGALEPCLNNVIAAIETTATSTLNPSNG